MAGHGSRDQPCPRVAVLGAGPTGVEAALAAHDRGWPVTVYEQAAEVAAYVRMWGHVRLFTPWSMNVSPRVQQIAGPAGERCPAGHEFAAHLAGIAALLPDVRLGTRIEHVARERLLKSEEIATERRGNTAFRRLVTGPDGTERIEHADVVLDCTGTYGNPNPAGSGGIPALGERAAGAGVLRTIPVVGPEWVGRRVLLVGAGFSAQTAARDLAAAGARLTWAVRAADPGWGAVPDDTLPARAELVASSVALATGSARDVEVRTGVTVEEIRPAEAGTAVTLRDTAGVETVFEVDVVVSLTGFVGDSRMYRQLLVHECYATEGPITLAATVLDSAGGDCLEQTSEGVDVLRNPEPNFFVLGSKSHGRNNTFLVRTGWQQVEEVFAALDADLPAAS